MWFEIEKLCSDQKHKLWSWTSWVQIRFQLFVFCLTMGRFFFFFCNHQWLRLSICKIGIMIAPIHWVIMRICLLSCVSRVQIFVTMDCSPPGSSVHRIPQARILECVAMPSSRGSSQPRDQTCISWGSCITGRFYTVEPPGKLLLWGLSP